jgi:hypothetical protein
LTFFVTDGILVPVFGWTGRIKVDDASSSGNGQLAYWQNKTGSFNLPADSPWRTDLSKYMAIITYQQDTSKIAAPWIVNPYSATAKEINETDKLYGRGGGGGDGGGAAPIAPGY